MDYHSKFYKMVRDFDVTKDPKCKAAIEEIIDVLCKYELEAYKGVAILEKCGFEVLGGSKIRKKH